MVGFFQAWAAAHGERAEGVEACDGQQLPGEWEGLSWIKGWWRGGTKELETPTVVGQGEILELLVSVGCSSTDGADKIGVQSNAETVRGAGKNVAVEQKCERFRGRCQRF